MRRILDFRGIFTNINTRTIYFYSVIVGALAGLGALIFNKLLILANEFTMGRLAQLAIPVPHGEVEHITASGEPNRLLLLLLPAVGGLIAGLIVKTYAPEAEGTGTDSYIHAFHNKGGMMRGRVPLIKSLATIATLATGGSAGKEGPIAQIGSGVGSALGRYINMGARARRTMLLAGAAGGLGAIFRAPLGGALTAVEVLYKEDLETDALTPCILSSLAAYTVFCSVVGFQHVFVFQTEVFKHPVELIFYGVLGLVCSVAGLLYVRFFWGVKKHFFDKLPINKYLVPPIGGLMVGAIGFFYPEVMGQGFGYIQQLIDGRLFGGGVSVGLLAALAVLKIMTTSFTISSGGSGGVFAPSLFIGAMLGGCVGTLSHNLFPGIVPDVAPFVVVGMGAFFAGVANAPIASLMMVCELTGAYELLPPLMVVATIALVTSRRWSIYLEQVDNKFFSKAHLWEMNPNVLKRLSIGEGFKDGYNRKAVISASMPLHELEAFSREARETDLILENQRGELSGFIAMNDVYYEQDLQELRNLVLAHDLKNRKIFYLTEGDSLIRALEMFNDSDFDKIPIVKMVEGQRGLLGYIQYRDVLKFYEVEQQQELAARR